MKIPLAWLQDWIPVPLDAHETARRLTLAGLEVESIDIVGGRFRGVVIGRILSVGPVPGADKLRLCRVDAGSGEIPVVCGAPNVRDGILVPVALEGAELPGNMKIRRTVIRNAESAGMICSARELGLGDDHSGILVLDDPSLRPGDAFTDREGNDFIFDINVTPNRPDCLCVRGIAREVALLHGCALRSPETVKPVDAAGGPVDIRIEDPDGCSRYTARRLKDIRIGPSPEWIRKRIEAAGMHAINNIVDITNYVMLETGQPLHAFDADLLDGGRIIVRRAGEIRQFTTLDGQERRLSAEDLLICDGARPVALAGIMGGRNSEVSEGTRRILLESAHFDPMTIRRTVKRIGISSEASIRMEKGVDPSGTRDALERAIAIMVELSGGCPDSGVTDVVARPIRPVRISLRPQRIRRVLGAEIPHADILRILSGLGMTVEGTDPVEVTVPTRRPDVTGEIDLIEEVVRHFGYDRIEPSASTTGPTAVHSNREDEFIERLRDILSGMGFTEVFNNSMVDRQSTDLFFAPVPAVPVRNPLSPETAFLRTALMPGLMESVRWNQNRSVFDLRLFEIGRVFEHRGEGLPEERVRVAGVISESARQKGYWKSRSPRPDWYAVKGTLEALAEALHLKETAFRPSPGRGWVPGTAAVFEAGGKRIGSFGEADPSVRAACDVSERVFGFELDGSALLECLPQSPVVRPVPRYPAVRRDLALVVDAGVPVGSIQQTLLLNGGGLLVSADLFDLYQGKQIPAGRKSLAFTLAFLSPERTLTDADVDPLMNGIIRCLESVHGASLRS
ncbi:phenylalanine--tRNA ligase subunit beta [bacterium]|nr:phenylalanine--tRNA ligase subunit beta [bacterium]